MHHDFKGCLVGDVDQSLGRKRSPRPKKPMSRPASWSGAWDWGAYPEADAQMADFELAQNAAKALKEGFDKPFFMSVKALTPSFSIDFGIKVLGATTFTSAPNIFIK